MAVVTEQVPKGGVSEEEAHDRERWRQMWRLKRLDESKRRNYESKGWSEFSAWKYSGIWPDENVNRIAFISSARSVPDTNKLEVKIQSVHENESILSRFTQKINKQLFSFLNCNVKTKINEVFMSISTHGGPNAKNVTKMPRCFITENLCSTQNK